MKKLLERKETEIYESKGTNKPNGYKFFKHIQYQKKQQTWKQIQILGFLDVSSLVFPATKNRELKSTHDVVGTSWAGGRVPLLGLSRDMTSAWETPLLSSSVAEIRLIRWSWNLKVKDAEAERFFVSSLYQGLSLGSLHVLLGLGYVPRKQLRPESEQKKKIARERGKGWIEIAIFTNAMWLRMR